MLDPNTFSKCSEFYIIEKVVEVVASIGGNNHTFRIEGLFMSITGRYLSRAYRQEHVTVQPTYPRTHGQHDRKPEEMRIWVDYSLPWTDGDSADSVIHQSLRWLEERCD